MSHRIKDELFRLILFTVGSTNPPAPMKAASVVVPISITMVVDTPTIIVFVVKGSSNIFMICAAIIPFAIVVFFNSSGTVVMPVRELLTIGN